jgi:hypothetical protein
MVVQNVHCEEVGYGHELQRKLSGAVDSRSQQQCYGAQGTAAGAHL